MNLYKIKHIDSKFHFKMANVIIKHKELKEITDKIVKCQPRDLNLAFNKILNTDKLGFMPMLITLNLTHNGLTEISPHIKNLIHLTELNLAFNKITKLPAEIANLHKLKKLNVSRNALTELCKVPADLEILQAHYNKIKTIPDMSHCRKMMDINLGHNQIVSTAGFKNLKLSYLRIEYNKLTSVGPEFGTMHARHLDFSFNKISTVSDDIRNIQNLQHLTFTHNKLTEISSAICAIGTLITLTVSSNQITEINSALAGSKLSMLCVDSNKITHLPLWLADINFRDFSWRENPIENILNPVIVRFLQRFNVHLNNFYSDAQNIHSESIQASVRDSVRNIMEQATPGLKYNYLLEPNITPTVKHLLFTYCADKSVHSVFKCTFEELLHAVFKLIHSEVPREHRSEIRKRFHQEIMDSRGMCFTGRMTHLVNVLSGYSTRVIVSISPAEEIGNVISVARLKYSDPAEVKFHVNQELLERKYSPDVIKEWLDHIE